MQDRRALLSLALGFNKAHLGPLGRHHNRLSIGCVVLLALHKWAHVARRDQPDLVAKSAQHTRPVMSATARLHYDRGGWMPGHERARRLPRQLTLKLNLAVHRRTVKLENRLRSEEHTSELQSLMRNSYPVFFLKK